MLSTEICEDYLYRMITNIDMPFNNMYIELKLTILQYVNLYTSPLQFIRMNYFSYRYMYQRRNSFRITYLKLRFVIIEMFFLRIDFQR